MVGTESVLMDSSRYVVVGTTLHALYHTRIPVLFQGDTSFRSLMSRMSGRRSFCTSRPTGSAPVDTRLTWHYII